MPHRALRCHARLTAEHKAAAAAPKDDAEAQKALAYLGKDLTTLAILAAQRDASRARPSDGRPAR